jgi:hypothetical protein
LPWSPGDSLFTTNPLHGASRKVDPSFWPTAYTAAQNTKLKGPISELVVQSLPITLQKLPLAN